MSMILISPCNYIYEEASKSLIRLSILNYPSGELKGLIAGTDVEPGILLVLVPHLIFPFRWREAPNLIATENPIPLV